MLCTLCQNIQFKRTPDLTREEKIDLLTYYDLYPPEEEEEDDYDDEVLSRDLEDVGFLYESFYFHHRNLESLRKAADDGCNFCYQIFYGLLETTELDHDVENSSERLYLSLQPPGIHNSEMEHSYNGDLSVHLGAESLGSMRLRELDEFAPGSQNMEHNSSTGSSTNLDLAARWLHNCANSHEYCCHQPQIKSILPYRVLDIGDLENPRKVFLSVGEDRIGSYAALSYCWGKPETQRKYLTTIENLEQQQEAVDISIFPKTFTDAIVVCRHLRIRFLWIDSLCIIQYDKIDWQTQSERMGDIYSNAALTISAAVGEDSHSGLFVDRDSRKTYPATLNFQYPKEDGVISKGAFLTCPDSYWLNNTCLETRGWTFQEKYLSPRTLSFSKTEMHWTCASSHSYEGLPMGLHPLTNKSDFDRYIKVDANGALPIQLDMVQRYHWWYDAIEVYSHRIFTHESDRLMALAGLASRFQRPDDEFLYGLWKADLVHGLAWKVDGGSKETTKGTSLTSTIPSWSWASRPGKIITYSDGDMFSEPAIHDGQSIISYHTPEGSLQHTFIEISSEEPILPATISPASSTTQILRLRGLLLKFDSTKDSIAYDRSDRSLKLFRHASSLTNQMRREFLGETFYDEPVMKGDNLYCLQLYVLPSESSGKPNRANNATAEMQRPFGEIGIDELVSMQNKSLELGMGTLPEMTWCAGPISLCWLRSNDYLSCLLLKRVDAKEMKFRRVGYLKMMDGRLFEGLAPVTLEII